MSQAELNELLRLPNEQFKEVIYAKYYSNWIYGNRSNRLAHQLLHKSLEKNLEGLAFEKTLEIGARNLEHFEYVNHEFSSYTLSDIDDLGPEIPTWKTFDQRIDFTRDDITNSNFKSEEFDRVVVTCVMHHVLDVEKALMEIRRIVKTNGIVDILLPCDPGLMYRLAKQIGPYRYARIGNYLKLKKLLDARDHINHYLGILEILKFVYRDDKISQTCFPFKPLGYNFNLWTTLRITKLFERVE